VALPCSGRASRSRNETEPRLEKREPITLKKKIPQCTRRTVDYEGEIWLEFDDAKTIHLNRGDVFVQNGTRNAWRNKGTRPATMLFFLNGAKE
jgi:hypothetical protein